MIERRRVLQLNADYRLLSIISLKRAIGLFLSDKITILEEDRNLPIIHPLVGIRPPVVIVLKRYISVPYKNARLTRKNILLRDEYQCQYCGIKLGKHNSTVDHIIPRSHKDSPGNRWTNLVACCNKCNSYKDNRLLSETNLKLKRLPYKPQLEDLVVMSRELRETLKKFRGER